MIDDPAMLDRQIAYLDAIRARGRRERSLGLIASLVGVLIVVVARFRLSGAPWALCGAENQWREARMRFPPLNEAGRAAAHRPASLF